MDPWNQVRDELVHLLEEWGVSGNHTEHVRFRQRVFQETCAMHQSKTKSPDYDALKLHRFPTDYKEAVEFVFRSDIEEDCPQNPYYYSDRLAKNWSQPPYYRQFAKENPTRVVGYRLKRDFKDCRLESLDPFRRFKFTKYSSEAKLWYSRWFLSSPESDAGTIYEARFACCAIQHQACYNSECRIKNSLRWYGGSKASWQDLVCIACKSTYELKTKESMEKIEANFQRNEITGGSYLGYCQLRNSPQGKHQKHYLVMLPRTFTVNRAGEKCHPVFIAEIDKVLPKLTPSSFNSALKRLQIRTRVSVKLRTKRHWFDLPKTEAINYMEILERLYIKKFSKREFDYFEELYFSDDETDSESSKQEQANEASTNSLEDSQTMDHEGRSETVENLKAELEKMKVGDDECENWEDLFTD